MKNKTYRNFYIFSLIGILIVSFYPLYIGVRIIWDMVTMGYTLPYFRYIIPVLPLCLSVIIGVAIMPVLMKITKKFSLLIAFVIASGVFLLCEILLENQVVVECYGYANGFGNYSIEYSGMSVADKGLLSHCCMFYEPEVVYKPLLEDVIGGLHSSFKLHFYVVTLLLVFCILSCFYGFGYMLKYDDNSKKKYLILQVVFSSVFLCVCIASCFIDCSPVFECLYIYDTNSVKSIVIKRMFLLLNTLSLQIAVSVCIASVFANCKKWLSVLLPLTVTTIISWFTYIGLQILLANMYGTSIYGSIVEVIKMSLFVEMKYHTATPVIVVNMFVMLCISGGILLLLSKKSKKEILDSYDEKVEMYYFD